MALPKERNVSGLVDTASGTAAGCAWAEVTAVFTWLRGCWEGLLLQRCAGSAEKLVCPQGVCVGGRVGALKTCLQFFSETLGFIFPSG